jgi:putative SOS response-associated peptidase YedK
MAAMCNEFRFRQALDKLIEEFSRLELPLHWGGGAPNLEPRDSIRPTDPAVVIQGSETGCDLRSLRWGFQNPKGGPIINYRSESRDFASGRCLVPADGFYEFTGDKSPKAKWLFEAAGDPLFCIAGLIRGDRFTLLTAEPGPDVAPYHRRQIVILPRHLWGAWLGPGPAPPLPTLPEGSLVVRRIR